MIDSIDMINRLVDDSVNISRERIKNLISLCESPIETIFFLKVYSYFFKVNETSGIRNIE